MNTEQRIRKALREAASGTSPRPMPEKPRDHAWHWGTYIDGPSRPAPPSRFPLWRDTILAIITGLLLGPSITFAVVRGFWPPAGVLGVLSLVVHLVAIGLGQTVDEARLTRSDLRRIAAISGSAILVGALVAFVLMV